ncbi:MAG: hypothetical protein JWQ23_3542 [Herminiimonas sp.]|jgi:hypothetical protein|nr:hypothetical protein [Herminiimonas sp.]
MGADIIGEYEIEYAGIQLHDAPGWAAHVAIYGPSHNPMHRNIIFADQRVLVETVFDSQQAAEDEAHKVALSMLANP